VSRVVVLIVTWLLTISVAQARTIRRLDFDWRFNRKDTPQASRPNYDDSTWRLVDIPHDWSIEGAYNRSNPGGGVVAYLPTGVGWYRQTFNVSSEMLEQSVWVVFDGAFMDSTVWINGYKLGERPYGYVSFFYKLTGHLHAGRNVLSVRVDNRLQPAARWYTGSGIYGHVQLIVANPVHVAQWGTLVRTSDVKQDRAVVAVTTTVDGCETAKAEAQLQYDIFDISGREVANLSVVACAGNAGDDQTVTLPLKHPELWSPSSPTLYTLRSRIVLHDQIVDETNTTFGVRTAVFDPQRGFLLNGTPLKLKGVSDHLYSGSLGLAIPETILARDLRMLKAMGANAILTAHNPNPPAFYDLCDQMGLLVVDEIFDGWQQKAAEDYGARFFKQWWKRDLGDSVKRDRNHPSIILWGIGNETGLTDTLGISAAIHALDPTRPTTGGRVHFGVDVAGFNGEGEIPGVLEKFHADHPLIPIVLTEVPHTLQTRGYYRVRTWWRDWKHFDEFPAYGNDEIFFDGKQWFNSSYDNAIVRITARQSWRQVERTPWIAGCFRWSGFDHLGSANYKGGRWPDRAENFGVIDLAGIPKDDYYLYQSMWTSKPMVHVLPHWTHQGMEGVVIPVVAYSNQPEVELFLNGHSVGRHKPGPLGDFSWKVPYEPGTLKAVAYSQKGDITASDISVTAGMPEEIRLSSDNTSLKADGRDTAVVTITAVDKNGVMVPWDMNRVDFKVTGPIRILGYENGDPTDVTPNFASSRRLFYGMARGFYQSTTGTAPAEVTAVAILGDQSLGSESHTPRTVAIYMQRIALRGALGSSKFEIRYTMDGTKPQETSKLYSGPFQILRDTEVRALILRNGRPFMDTRAHFREVDPSITTDPRWATSSQVDPVSRNR